LKLCCHVSFVAVQDETKRARRIRSTGKNNNKTKDFISFNLCYRQSCLLCLHILSFSKVFLSLTILLVCTEKCVSIFFYQSLYPRVYPILSVFILLFWTSRIFNSLLTSSHLIWSSLVQHLTFLKYLITINKKIWINNLYNRKVSMSKADTIMYGVQQRRVDNSEQLWIRNYTTYKEWDNYLWYFHSSIRL
jgi:hypothetical protein